MGNYEDGPIPLETADYTVIEKVGYGRVERKALIFSTLRPYTPLPSFPTEPPSAGPSQKYNSRPVGWKPHS
jgi:hypothetical protein